MFGSLGSTASVRICLPCNELGCQLPLPRRPELVVQALRPNRQRSKHSSERQSVLPARNGGSPYAARCVCAVCSAHMSDHAGPIDHCLMNFIAPRKFRNFLLRWEHLILHTPQSRQQGCDRARGPQTGNQATAQELDANAKRQRPHACRNVAWQARVIENSGKICLRRNDTGGLLHQISSALAAVQILRGIVGMTVWTTHDLPPKNTALTAFSFAFQYFYKRINDNSIFLNSVIKVRRDAQQT